MTAIITCGETRASLAAVRALGRQDIPVAVGAKKRPTLAMWSRYASSTFLTEDPSINAKKFSHNLGRELKARYALSAMVSSDQAFWALSRYRELLPESAHRILPPHYSVVRSLDPEALHNFARPLGISCTPLVLVPEHAPMVSLMALIKGLAFPLLLKPLTFDAAIDGEGFAAPESHVAGSLAQVVQLMKELRSSKGFLVSEYRRDRVLAYFGVASQGQVLVEGFLEHVYELASASTISPIPALRRQGQNLLNALRWQGPFKIEFYKAPNGDYQLSTLVGRLWASLQLAISAGVNIPLICYRLAEDTLTKKILSNARPQVRMRWLMSEARDTLQNPSRAISSLKDQVRTVKLSSLWRAMISKNKIANYYDIFDIDDPMPFFFEIQNKTWKKAFGDRIEKFS